jgi:hypothetical protein
MNPRLIAFYLPQFHPIPENDAWWGRGFTEWTNVTRAKPLFEGHQQPRRPADLGFYDLRVPEIRELQADLARAHGIHGFCYYYYWFGGRRLLERPLDDMISSRQPDLPFCICWANENWTRRWDGDEHEVLVGQDHSPESDRRFILDVIPILRDPRYIRFEGKPVLLVYRAGMLPDPSRTTEVWRERSREHGIPDLHLVAAQTFGLGDPRPLGFDAAVEFPPHGIRGYHITHEIQALHPEFRGKIYDYRHVVDSCIHRPKEPYQLHRGVMVAWDNTARRGLDAHVYHHGSAEEYERWLGAILSDACQDTSSADPMIFVNAWNEWAEGAYLEPDFASGHAYLQATRRTLIAARATPRASQEPGSASDPQPPEALRTRVRELEEKLEGYARANRYLSTELEARDANDAAEVVAFSVKPPDWIPSGELSLDGFLEIEQLGPLDGEGQLSPARGRRLQMSGRTTAADLEPTPPGSYAALLLRSSEGAPVYFAPIRSLAPVSECADGSAPCTLGFCVLASYEEVEAGSYEIGCVLGGLDRAVVAISGMTIHIPDFE